MELDIRRVLKQRKGFLMLTNIVLHSFQRRLGMDLGVQPGAEMAAAVAAAEADERPLCAVRPRDPGDVAARVAARRGWWGRLKLLVGTAGGGAFSNEKLDGEPRWRRSRKSGALQSMLDELADYLPQVKEVLIDERDRYLAAAHLRGRRRSATVAVVGAGHVPGIRALAVARTSAERRAPKSWTSWITCRLPAGWWRGCCRGPSRRCSRRWWDTVSCVPGAEVTIEKLAQWVLVNGTLRRPGRAGGAGAPGDDASHRSRRRR